MSGWQQALRLESSNFAADEPHSCIHLEFTRNMVRFRGMEMGLPDGGHCAQQIGNQHEHPPPHQLLYCARKSMDMTWPQTDVNLKRAGCPWNVPPYSCTEQAEERLGLVFCVECHR